MIRTLIKLGCPYANKIRDAILYDGDSGDLQILLDAGAFVDIRMNVSKKLELFKGTDTASTISLKGFTPLLFAIAHERYEHAELLLENGASATSRTRSVGDDAVAPAPSVGSNGNCGTPLVKMGRFSALHLIAATINGSSENNEQAIQLSQKLIDKGLKLTEKDSSHKTGNNQSIYSLNLNRCHCV